MTVEKTFANLMRSWADRRPELDVLTFDLGDEGRDEIRTYAELWANGNRIAAALIANGMRPGDRFAIMLRNHPEFIEAMIAASITGTVFAAIDPRTKGAKLAFTLNDAGCRGIICADYSIGQVADVRDMLPLLEWVWLLDAEKADAEEVTGCVPMSAILSEPQVWITPRSSAVDVLQITYTSGTTGDPKGAVRTNQYYGGPGVVGELFGFSPDDRPYTGLSLTHGAALNIIIQPALGFGQRAVVSRKFTKSRLWDITRRYECSYFMMLGGIATALFSEPERPGDADNPVRFVISAGMPTALWDRFEKRFGVDILEMYGATEGGFTYKPARLGPVGSFGKQATTGPSPALTMLVVDENDRECAPGELGELVWRPIDGEPASIVYWNNPETSARKTRGGWMRTGDICHRDEDDWLFFDHRMGDGIRRNGDFINPGLVESALASSQQVDDAFVYGVVCSHNSPGESAVVAAIVLAADAAFDAIDLIDHCERELERSALPSYFQIVDQIPKTASEKPQARFLRDELVQEIAAVCATNGSGVGKTLTWPERQNLFATSAVAQPANTRVVSGKVAQ
jgi:crotonobetaine/carnitine-CoA ligase